MSDNETRYVGLSWSGLLGVAFIVLKLTHVINWSWWFVLMPFYVPLVLALVIFAVIFIIVKAFD